MPNTDVVYENNIKTLQKVGIDGLRALGVTV
jgi:hypothetical protein